MTQKLPREVARPGMFVSVGPSGFTAAAMITMAEGAQRALSDSLWDDNRLAPLVLKIIANWASLWIWGLALWFFLISVGSHWCCLLKGHRMTFTMAWYSYVFPNSALITATFAVGKAFQSRAIQIIGCVMTPMLIAMWFLVSVMMIRAILNRQILWPQKGEDRDEGGFKAPRKNSADSV